jgi:hypothetical protein
MELICTISCVESKPIQTPYIHWELTINRITEIAKMMLEIQNNNLIVDGLDHEDDLIINFIYLI